jgi:PelA/Pel-15E family pectate lyase
MARLPRAFFSPVARFALMSSMAALACDDAWAAALARSRLTVAIDTSGFRDATNHWRKINEPERVMQPLPDQPSYAPDQVREIAANVLLFQRQNGGWPKDYDMLAVLTADQKKAIQESHARTDTTFDNHTTHTQVDYLARAYTELKDDACRAACVRGLDFILGAQYPHGGFPQRWPNTKGIAGLITFNDGVMMGCLEVLKAAAEGEKHFHWLDAARRERARDAVRRGVECVLRGQIRVGQTLTGWGQQHDPKTFETTGARTFELACTSPADTTEIARFLMRLERTPEITRAVESAVAWLQRVTLRGVRVERVAAPPVEFFRHKTDFDVVVVKDQNAPPLWARTYEVGTDRPIFASRDGVKVYSLAEVDRERRTGSGWYGSWPRQLIENEFPAWRAVVQP